MKYSTLNAFEKHLEGASPHHFAEIYLILAKEAFTRKQGLDKLTSLYLKDEASPQFCFQLFDAEKHGVDAIIQELGTFAFFARRRLIAVQNVEAFDKSSTVKLEAYFAAPNRSICLVLAAASLNRATTFYKKAEKAGIILDIPDEKPWEREKSIADWLKREAAVHKKQIKPEICQMLVKQLGVDQSLLQSELLKLICYVGERTVIDEKDVSAICGSVNVDNAWQLGEALFRRDASTALRISKALLADGVALIALLRQIRSQFQTEYQVCSIMVHGGSSADVAKEFPYMKGAILERHVKQAQSYGMHRLKKGLLSIDEVELQAKNSTTDPDFLAEQLIIKLAI